MRTLSIIFLLFFVVVALVINAPSPLNANSDKEQEETEPSVQVVEYNLPYPGILPDHFLYPLKNLRDQLLNFLIRDPVKRVDYLTLMADKRFAMSMYLTDKEKYGQAVDIAEEGEEYYGRIPEQIKTVKDQNKTITAEQFENLINSATKHKEVVLGNIKKDLKEDKNRYTELIDLINENMKKIEEMRE